MKIVFFGTSPFAAIILERLIASGIEIEAIITRPDKPKGRSGTPSAPPVKVKALQMAPNIPLFQPIRASSLEFKETLEKLTSDVFVVAAYGEILKPHVLAQPKKSCINVHGSILPQYRGAAPMQRALMDGKKETGVTIIEMAAEMDAGDILAIKKMPLSQEITLGELEPLLANLGAEALLEVIDQVEKGIVQPQPQNPCLVTFAPKITPEEERIDWSLTSDILHNRIRALTPHPGVWTMVFLDGESKRIKIKKTKSHPEKKGQPGENLECSAQRWLIACGQGALELLEVQLEGKKAMPAAEFLRGYQRAAPSFIEKA